MRLSEHAKQRWDERCSDLNLEDELVTLRPAGRPLLRKLRWLWENMHGAKSVPPEARTYWVSAHGALFIAIDDMAVTTMRTGQVRRWYAERRAKQRSFESMQRRLRQTGLPVIKDRPAEIPTSAGQSGVPR